MGVVAETGGFEHKCGGGYDAFSHAHAVFVAEFRAAFGNFRIDFDDFEVFF
jgi:hypothetical protein